MKTQILQQRNGMLLTVSQLVIISKDEEIKFLSTSIESSLCNSSDAYVLVTGDTAVTRTIAAEDDDPVKNNEPLAAATQVAFKNCAPF